MKLIGIDVSKGSATVCPLEVLPHEFKRYRKGVEKIELSKNGIEKLIKFKADGAILEPTGGHYSKLWAQKLSDAGITVRWVDHGAVDAYRRANRCPNKSDLHDSVALACYGLQHWENPGYFIKPSSIALKDYNLQIHHLNQGITATQNRIRQQLSHEWPEIASASLCRKTGENTPLLLRHIAKIKTTPKWTQKESESIGLGISPFSRVLAQQICTAQQHRADIETQIAGELQKPDYSAYIAAMQRMGITAIKLQSSLLCATYPFGRFLKNGRPIYEYVNTATGKRSRRNRSKASFKLACGLGMIRYQSGDKQGFRPGGSSDTRRAIYLWVRTMIVISGGRANVAPKSQFISDMQAYYRESEGPGNLKVQRVSRRLVEQLYKELLAEFDSQSNTAT